MLGSLPLPLGRFGPKNGRFKAPLVFRGLFLGKGPPLGLQLVLAHFGFPKLPEGFPDGFPEGFPEDSQKAPRKLPSKGPFELHKNPKFQGTKTEMISVLKNARLTGVSAKSWPWAVFRAFQMKGFRVWRFQTWNFWSFLRLKPVPMAVLNLQTATMKR